MEHIVVLNEMNRSTFMPTLKDVTYSDSLCERGRQLGKSLCIARAATRTMHKLFPGGGQLYCSNSNNNNFSAPLRSSSEGTSKKSWAKFELYRKKE